MKKETIFVLLIYDLFQSSFRIMVSDNVVPKQMAFHVLFSL